MRPEDRPKRSGLGGPIAGQGLDSMLRVSPVARIERSEMRGRQFPDVAGVYHRAGPVGSIRATRDCHRAGQRAGREVEKLRAWAVAHSVRRH
jgi:hypothetical protein